MPKSVAIMQPYFLPYLGYWQLMDGVDEFVVYDDIQYTKKGWINRNRYLVNGEAKYFTLPLKKDSDYLDVRDRCLSDDWLKERHKLLARIEGAYRTRPQFHLIMPLIEEIILFGDANLFKFIFNSIKKIASHLEIQTALTISSTLNVDNGLKGSERVKETCHKVGGDVYVNPPGGKELYNHSDFENAGLRLKFLSGTLDPYDQGGAPFIPGLSILDILMNNDMSEVKTMLKNYRFE